MFFKEENIMVSAFIIISFSVSYSLHASPNILFIKASPLGIDERSSIIMLTYHWIKSTHNPPMQQTLRTSLLTVFIYFLFIYLLRHPIYA